jgi:cytochrome c oxidase assembly factor 5
LLLRFSNPKHKKFLHVRAARDKRKTRAGGERRRINRATNKTRRKEDDMSKSCKGMLDEMLKCVEQSECCCATKTTTTTLGEEGGKRKDLLEFCVNALMHSDDETKVTALGLDECVVKKQVYLKCKRGQMDMRTRIRGNKGY